MVTTSVWCPVLGAHVTRVSDFEGQVARVICPEYDEATGTCRLKRAAEEGGPLGRLLERVAEDTLETRNEICSLRAA
jgi:hypothetical protein